MCVGDGCVKSDCMSVSLALGSSACWQINHTCTNLTMVHFALALQKQSSRSVMPETVTITLVIPLDVTTAGIIVAMAAILFALCYFFASLRNRGVARTSVESPAVRLEPGVPHLVPVVPPAADAAPAGASPASAVACAGALPATVVEAPPAPSSSTRSRKAKRVYVAMAGMRSDADSNPRFHLVDYCQGLNTALQVGPLKLCKHCESR